jgi:tetratricopeptide (TPR) repeat protein
MASPSADLPALLDAAARAFAGGRLDEAARLYRAAERRAPGDVRATYSLAVVDLQRGRPAEACARLEAAVAAEPGLFAAWHNLGAANQHLRRWDRAAAAYERALALQPEAVETRHGLATALAALGRIDAALAHHRALAGEGAPGRWRALTRIALLRPEVLVGEDISAMRQAAADPALDADIRTGLWFAVGEALEALERDDEAFAAFAQGNAMKREALGSAVAEAARDHARSLALVRARDTAEAIARRAGRGHPTTAPIFVVGFPRSGSTLIEQILASTPGVQGLGEIGAVSELAADVDREAPRALARRYLAAARAEGWDGTSRFVDKTLENYLHVGAIAGMFPNAVILHAVRDPAATGFACFRQLFVSGNETLYDLADIAAEHRRYQGLMAHWAQVLPGRIVDVGYEALVADPERQIPWLVTKAAGLAWDPAALRFFERERAVATASAAQVRRPIYAGSIDRWRRHEAALAPLIEGLRAPG